MSESVDLNAMTRAELNTFASEHGIADPESYATKADLIAAIEEAVPAVAAAAEPVERADALYYIGERDPVSDEPVQYILGVPATDLTTEQIQTLSDSEYAACLATGIYSTTKPSTGG